MALELTDKIKAVTLLIFYTQTPGITEAEKARHGELFDALPEEARKWAAYAYRHGFKNLGSSYGEGSDYTIKRMLDMDAADQVRADRETVRGLLANAAREAETILLQDALKTGAMVFRSGDWGPIPAKGAKVVKVNPNTSFTIEYDAKGYGNKPVREKNCIHWANWSKGYGRSCGRMVLSADRRAEALAKLTARLSERGLFFDMDELTEGLTAGWGSQAERDALKGATHA